MGEKTIVIYYFSKKNKIKYELIINLPLFQLKYQVANKVIYIINDKNLFDFEKMGKDFIPTEEDSMTSIKMDMTIPESILLTTLWFFYFIRYKYFMVLPFL